MSNASNAPTDLRDRTLVFAKNVLSFAKSLSPNLINKPIISQLVRSSSSVGANFVEAKNASSKKDFRNKVYISKKEASETLYWLNLCEEVTNSTEIQILQKECQELILILQKIITTLNH